jgi:hypothetical protein
LKSRQAGFTAWSRRCRTRVTARSRLYDARGEVLHCTSTDFGIEFRQALNDALDAFVLGARASRASCAARARARA